MKLNGSVQRPRFLTDIAALKRTGKFARLSELNKELQEPHGDCGAKMGREALSK
jgi:hypothetical protein